MPAFPLFAPSEEHRAVREAVRTLCEAKVAPYAAEVDEHARYPTEAAKVTQIYEGTNQVQRIVMTRQLLAGIQSEL